MDGFNKNYFENGKPQIEWTYKDGKREGLAKAYSAEGQLIREWEYKNDEIVNEKAYNKEASSEAGGKKE